MKKIFTLLAFFLFLPSLFASIEILAIKGDVKLIRNEQVSDLKKDTDLKKNDLIKTELKSFLRLKYYDSTITLAPGSYFKIENILKEKKEKRSAAYLGKLLYGHLYGKFIKSQTKKKPVRIIRMKTAALGIRGTQILLHVTRDSKEYAERMSGKDHPIPTLEELTTLENDSNLYSQICCIDGAIRVSTKKKKRVTMTEGQVINYKGMGAEVSEYQFTKEQNLNSARRLGLLFN